jgi:hypothetical protein
MKVKGFAALASAGVIGIVLAGSGFRAAVGQQNRDRQDRPEFTQRGEIEKTQRESGSSSEEKFGYASLQGCYAPMGEGKKDSRGAGIFDAGTPISKFYKVDLEFFSHGTIGGVPGEIYKTKVGGKEYYLLFSDRVYSDGYARIVVWKDGAYAMYVASRATQA